MRLMLGGLTSIRAHGAGLRSRRAMLDTLLKHLDMVRLSVGVLALMAMMACNGLVSQGGGGGGGSGSGTPEEQAAIKAWLDTAQPALTSAGCFGCHAGT